MSNRINSTAVCEDRGPRLPTGSKAGFYVAEEGIRVWERNIRKKHILRFLDALTINARLLRQIREDGVQLIRYRLDGDGAYEIPLAAFLERRSILQGFAGGEDVSALPRSEWRFMPEISHLDLFGFEGRA